MNDFPAFKDSLSCHSRERPLTTDLFDPAASHVPAGHAFCLRRGGNRARAFSLVEILVTMAVTLLLVLVLLQIFSGTQDTWRRSEEQVDAYREARGALQFMARDLGATLQENYAQAGGGSTSAAKPLLPTLLLQHAPDVPPEPNGPLNEEVYCLTNIPNTGVSSLCAAGYYCEWMPDFMQGDHVPHAYALMRRSLDSNGLYQRIQAANTGSSTIPLKFDSLFTYAGTPKANVTQLAAYIWDLRFRIDTDLNDSSSGTFPDGDAPTAPQDHSTDATTPKGPLYYNDTSNPSYPPRLPAYVEIRFRALSDLAGRRLEGNTSVTPATWIDTPGTTLAPQYVQIIQRNYQQFVLRVPLVNANPLPAPTPVPGS